jgi:hypothetical protein
MQESRECAGPCERSILAVVYDDKQEAKDTKKQEVKSDDPEKVV